MVHNSIQLKSIGQLLGEDFYVPSYQRGYRWTPKQVTDLLNDIWEFHRRENKAREEFYCLQPVVVARKENDWVLIDGQQRITTIYVLLSWLNEILKLLGKKKYSIRYETRPDSETFLRDIDLSKLNENIDYFHICNAYKAIEQWFGKRDGTARIQFLTTLLNDNESGRNVQVIWYEIDSKTDQIDIFTRLNMGKIALTNAELIRALFLRKTNFEKDSEDKFRLKRLQIASEWDYIENTLQKDSFWYFIHDNAKEYDTRIEFIFDLIKNKQEEDELHYTFYKFYEDFENGRNIDDLWKEVKNYFMTLEEWYNDRHLYHLIGYLIAIGEKIADVKSNSDDLSKTEFLDCIRLKIKDKFKNCQIDEVEFGNGLIKPILLLFNIQTLLNNANSNIRFPFDCFKTDHWDIEHIRSRKSDKPSPDKRRVWLESILEYFTGYREIHSILPVPDSGIPEYEKALLDTIMAELLADKISDDHFDIIYEKVLSHFKENDEPDNIDSISNLALLDSSTNRSYKNSVFPIKRRRIIENDKTGTFVPICTKNVFLKYYSKKLDGIMFWQESDVHDYLQAIKTTLSQYLPDQNNKHGDILS